MVYEYRCECGNLEEKELSMTDKIPKSVTCTRCAKKATRVWSNMSLNVPESMRATSDLYNSDTGANASFIKERMNKGKRPSGKDKVFY